MQVLASAGGVLWSGQGGWIVGHRVGDPIAEGARRVGEGLAIGAGIVVALLVLLVVVLVLLVVRAVRQRRGRTLAISGALVVVAVLVGWVVYSVVAYSNRQAQVAGVQAERSRWVEVEDREVEGFVARLQAAAVAGESARVLEMIDVARTLEAVDAALGPGVSAADRAAIEPRLPDQLVALFDPAVVETKVEKVDRGPEGFVVVYLRQRDRDRVWVESRWWLYADGDRLRWWDAEDLQLGERSSTLIAAVGMADLEPGPRQTVERLLGLGRLATLGRGDPGPTQPLAAAIDELDALDGTRLPAPLGPLVMLARASAAMARGEAEDALRRLDALRAEGLDSRDLPLRYLVRARAGVDAERWLHAAHAAQRYLDIVGPDARAYHVLGMAELGRSDRDDALEAFDHGLADDPWFSPLYAGMAMATDDVDEVAQRLQAIPEDAVLDGAVRWLSDEGDEQARAQLVAAAAVARPRWRDGGREGRGGSAGG